MIKETVPANQRVYLIFEPAAAGRTAMRLSLQPPSLDGGALAALIVRGLIMDGSAMDVDLVTDPTLDPDLKGRTGDDGPNGWTPVLLAEADGTRTLLKVSDWVRSTGKPGTGYLTSTGTLATAKADAFNFNSNKRVDMFTAQSDAGGIATVVFDPAFANAPAKALPTAIPNVLAGPIKAELVVGSLTKTGCKVKVTQQSLVGGIVAVLAGATVNVIAIEA